ncbi:uncharacterized protein CEXT_193471 [Caerostris extrusa]|uniref:Transposase IS30-like HTH domain-containing protein n=1 Tax=Caerostris extrusa TaxID=172846 RepID=A0AAV4PDW6_CAEEX|nr:uncharacterized protein CEXT_193471 [Caerostris extrusa]
MNMDPVGTFAHLLNQSNWSTWEGYMQLLLMDSGCWSFILESERKIGGKEITPEERKIIIKHRNEGKTLREIGKIVERTHSSIQRVINNYTSSKSIISKPRSGRPSKLIVREKRYVFKFTGKVSAVNGLSNFKNEEIVKIVNWLNLEEFRLKKNQVFIRLRFLRVSNFFQANAERVLNRKIASVRCDNGMEFL